LLKDDRLAAVAEDHNIAQFVSFGPGPLPTLRHSRMRVIAPGLATPEAAINCLLQQVPSVNIRTFRNHQAQGTPFHYQLTRADEILALLAEYARQGYYTIVNETVDVNDGGVSGVALGGLLEFAPQDTPRAVERPGVASVGFDLGLGLLSTVYGFDIDLPRKTSQRIEFSIHPRKVGLKRSHTILWQLDDVAPEAFKADLRWPNRFSRFLGDKAFGLLVAHFLGASVPRTTVLARVVAPFTFGTPTPTGETWIRTCPPVPVAGKFPTEYGWTDPFKLLQRADPDGVNISSVLSQDSVDAKYSGASHIESPGVSNVDGVRGKGDLFMLGLQDPDTLPAQVEADVQLVISNLQRELGGVRIEWAHDGEKVWVLQLHLADLSSPVGTLNSGRASFWLEFDPESGLDVLRELVDKAERAGAGIMVTKPVGITSHVGEIVRTSGVPSRIRINAE
jgi:hypothetical protein